MPSWSHCDASIGLPETISASWLLGKSTLPPASTSASPKSPSKNKVFPEATGPQTSVAARAGMLSETSRKVKKASDERAWLEGYENVALLMVKWSSSI